MKNKLKKNLTSKKQKGGNGIITTDLHLTHNTKNVYRFILKTICLHNMGKHLVDSHSKQNDTYHFHDFKHSCDPENDWRSPKAAQVNEADEGYHHAEFNRS